MDKATGLTTLALVEIIVGGIVGVLLMICLFMIFKKAKVAPWKAFIPFINVLNFFYVMSASDMFWGMFLTGGLLIVLGNLIPATALPIVLLILGYLTIAAFYLHACLTGAKRFGKTTGFGIGMFLLPVVFLPILAFSPAEYHLN